jgi:hypothetical protein
MNHLSNLILALLSTLLINSHAIATNESTTLKDDPINPLRIFAIFHDDIPESKRGDIYTNYIEPFTLEFESITGRKVSVIFDENIPPFSSFNYKNADPQTAIRQWKDLAWKYRKKRHDNNEFRFSDNDRVVLITNDILSGSLLFGGIAGIADRQTGWAVIASLETRQVIGHELGHTFNADHEQGEVLYRDGWWCETFMFPPLALRSSCLVFSDGNRKRIKDYVDSLY